MINSREIKAILWVLQQDEVTIKDDGDGLVAILNRFKEKRDKEMATDIIRQNEVSDYLRRIQAELEEDGATTT